MNEIATIPDGWKVIRFGDIAEFKNGVNFEATQKGTIGTPTIDVFNMYSTGNTIDLTNLYRVNKEFDESYILKKGDLLFVRSSLKREGVGWTSLFNGSDEPTTYCGFIIRARISDDSIDKIFLTNYFRSDFARQHLIAGSDKVAITNINQGILNNIQVPLPPPFEQHTISYILSLIQKAIQKQEEIISTATELKSALMQKLFTEGTKNEKQKETVIGFVPQSWEVVELNKTGDVIYGIQAAVANNTKPIGTKILTNVNITLDGKIDLEKVRYYKLKSKRDFNTVLRQGDILFNWRSGSKEHVGKTAIFNLEGEYTHSSFILRIRPNKRVDNYFLFLYLFYLRATGYFVKQQTYSINAKFNKSAIDVLPVTLPSPDEQKTIAESIMAANKKLEQHEAKKQTLTELFKSMLQKLMTGEVRVTDLDLRKEYSFEEENLSMAAEP